MLSVKAICVILLAFSGMRNEDIAPVVGLERHQIGIWRARWSEAFDRLVLVECMEGVVALRQAIRELLADAPRAGCPGKFTADQLARIFATACEDPEKLGYPFTHWTHAELAKEVIKRGIVESISVRHLGRLPRIEPLSAESLEEAFNTGFNIADFRGTADQ